MANELVSGVTEIEGIGLVTTASKKRVSHGIVSRFQNERFRQRVGIGMSAVGLAALKFRHEANVVSPILGAIVDGIEIVSFASGVNTLAYELYKYSDRKERRKQKR